MIYMTSFHLKAKARIGPWLSCMCQIRLTAASQTTSSSSLSPPSSRYPEPSPEHYPEPFSCEHGTHKTVKARFWSWLSGQSSPDFAVGSSSVRDEAFLKP